MSETRSRPGGGAMSAEQIERELGQLRMNEDGTLGLRSSVLNLLVVTDEDSASEVTDSVSGLADRYPCRAIVMISDPDDERDLDIGLSAFCSVRGGSSAQVCAEQITVHAQGPPAEHLESFAGPLLISDLPTFLWYPGPFSPEAPELPGLLDLADRLIIDSAASEGPEDSLRGLAGLLEGGTPGIGDLQWVALSPWRSMISDVFAPRAGSLGEVHHVEVLYGPGGECRTMLLVGWLASALGWEPEHTERHEEGYTIEFSGGVRVEASNASTDARLRRIRLYSGDLSFQVSRHRQLSDVRTTVMRGEELLGERTVHLGRFDLGVLLGEELQYRGHDHAYEAALQRAVEILSA